MKKIILTFSILFVALASVAQVKAFSATIANEKGVFSQTATSSVTRFDITANEAKVKEIKEKIAPMTYAKLEMKKTGKDTYSCKLSINNSGASSMVQRIFLHIGFETFTFNGAQKKTEELAGILQQLLL